jgi:hypothetical protein
MWDLTPLSHLTQLRLLNLYGTQVSEVTPITALTILTSLNINGAHVSEEAYQTLRRALPAATSSGELPLWLRLRRIVRRAPSFVSANLDLS